MLSVNKLLLTKKKRRRIVTRLTTMSMFSGIQKYTNLVLVETNKYTDICESSWVRF